MDNLLIANNQTVGDVYKLLIEAKFTSPNFDRPETRYEILLAFTRLADGRIQATRLTITERGGERYVYGYTWPLVATKPEDVILALKLVYPDFVPSKEMQDYAASI